MNFPNAVCSSTTGDNGTCITAPECIARSGQVGRGDQNMMKVMRGTELYRTEVVFVSNKLVRQWSYWRHIDKKSFGNCPGDRNIGTIFGMVIVLENVTVVGMATILVW